MVFAANLGFPRIGGQRELKKALEAFWKGEGTEAQLEQTAKDIRKTNWQLQQAAGIQHIPSNDFSYYDQVLDTIALFGAVPARYEHKPGEQVSLKTYFSMARGLSSIEGKNATHTHDASCGTGCAGEVGAMEMTKWFDTNYHYIVPEFTAFTNFTLSTTKPVDQFNEAKALGITTRPVILGPVSFLLLGKMKDATADGAAVSTLSLLPKLLPVYAELLGQLAKAGAEWVQIDEPCLVLEQSAEVLAAYKTAFEALGKAKGNLKLLIATYFDDVASNIDTLFAAPADAFHFDLVRAPEQLDAALDKLPEHAILSLGVVDGRNIWKNNFDKSLVLIEKAVAKLGSDRVMVAPSCSLLHTPVDLDFETKLDAEIKGWLAFAKQKLSEVAVLTKAANEGRDAVKAELAANAESVKSRSNSTRIHNQEVKARTAQVTEADLARQNPYHKRAKTQADALKLPLLPTTTIGSFPQTAEVRAARAQFKKGSISEAEYNRFLQEETIKAIRVQEELGIDVLVHGEFERNDMVEYFGEQLNGFAFTQNGWVQSYGSRCVKPPVIFGDVSRKGAMTVEWSSFSQQQTKALMKGMLTGPVTILQWSFVRDDQPRSLTCKQIGLAIRDEVVDLEKAGIKVIQIDEPAIREGLPLHKSEWAHYLKWAVDSFRLSAAGVKDETQIHTHMCYSEFNDIIGAIAAMDADVISIETSRSQMELLDAFVGFKYPNEIGPGVYDIHSPRVPSEEEMVALLDKALHVLKPEQIWVNPDCGLKTRGWKEVKPALELMVKAAKRLRADIEQGKKRGAA